VLWWPVGVVKSLVKLGNGGCEIGAFEKNKRNSTGNHFEEEDFYLDGL
jgi:hypothetical protein